MNIYTLGTNFKRRELIEEISSIIWTERYIRNGDTELVVPPTPFHRAELTEGRLLSLDDTEEIMVLETVLIEDGKLKAKGPTMDKTLLENRVIRTSNAQAQKDVKITGTPGWVMGNLVTKMAITPIISPPSPLFGVGLPAQAITGLTLGAIDNTGASSEMTFPAGQLYPAILALAESSSVGFSLYLDGFDGGGNAQLKFTTYRGTDRTVPGPNLVRFSPELESLTNITELRSIEGYKTVCFAWAPTVGAGLSFEPGMAEAYPGAAGATNFDARRMQILVEDITEEDFSADLGRLKGLLDQKAREALAANNRIRTVDGEITPQSEFVFGTHYGMGDIVQLEGDTGLIQRARVMEYIRTKDNTGERSYPSVELLD